MLGSIGSGYLVFSGRIKLDNMCSVHKVKRCDNTIKIAVTFLLKWSTSMDYWLKMFVTILHGISDISSS